ncbi:hypothetical protein CCUS01_04650 [Colletotrichum cuscutae]|uniref:Uncharacterized protein n=1 Tax=Colletotrichum cuscutae TaxID=1209917 RepID=A0AAI9VFP7_9PEZI|nr:hypothetical protein CCUS01_04650 [Colletotrichum cuscutae]
MRRASSETKYPRSIIELRKVAMLFEITKGGDIAVWRPTYSDIIGNLVGRHEIRTHFHGQHMVGNPGPTMRLTERTTLRFETRYRPNARPGAMDLELDSTSITVAREVTVASDEDLASRRRATKTASNSRQATTTRAATLAKERVKPVNNDESTTRSEGRDYVHR